MESLKLLYKKLWQSLIRPRRMAYSDYDLGGALLSFGDNFAMRLDFQLKNALSEEFNVSIYLPCDESEKIKPDMNFVVYCHTHNGNRLEGLSLAEKAITSEMGFVVFDFRANGFSSGKYVTLGWLEALDINEVIRFLKIEVKAKSICLWGRSMGGCAILFYLSNKCREKINESAIHLKHPPVQWVNRSWIQCVVIDSSFPNLIDSVSFMVKNKAKQVPEMLVGLVLKAANGDIKEKAGIDLTRINPIDYISEICNPVYMIIGNEDELVRYDQFSEMYRKCDSKIKKLKLFKGSHAEDRPDELYVELFDFIREMFKLKNHYLEMKKAQSMSINETETVAIRKAGETLLGDISGRFVTCNETFDVNRFGKEGNSKMNGDFADRNKSNEIKRKQKLKIYDGLEPETSILKTHQSFARPKIIQVQKHTSFITPKNQKLVSKKNELDGKKRGISPLTNIKEFTEKLKKSESQEKLESFNFKLSALRLNQEGVVPKWEKSIAINETLNETMGNLQTDKFVRLMKESNLREKSVEKLIGNSKTELGDLSIRIKSKPTLAGKTRLNANAQSRVIGKNLEVILEIGKESVLDESLGSSRNNDSRHVFEISQLMVSESKKKEEPFVPELRESNVERIEYGKLGKLAEYKIECKDEGRIKMPDLRKLNPKINSKDFIKPGKTGDNKLTNYKMQDGLDFNEFNDLDQLVIQKMQTAFPTNKNFEIYNCENSQKNSEFFELYVPNKINSSKQVRQEYLQGQVHEKEETDNDPFLIGLHSNSFIEKKIDRLFSENKNESIKNANSSKKPSLIIVNPYTSEVMVSRNESGGIDLEKAGIHEKFQTNSAETNKSKDR